MSMGMSTRSGPRPPAGPPPASRSSPSIDAEAILAGNGEVLDRTAREVAERMVAGGVKPTQVRNLYSYIRRMRRFQSYELWMFRPRLAYAVARAREMDLTTLQRPLLQVLDRVQNDEQFRRFQDFFEAIVAYHAVKSAEAEGGRGRGSR